MQILYQKVGLTPNGGPGSVAGLSTSGCMCVYVCVCVCVWPVGAPVKVRRCRLTVVIGRISQSTLAPQCWAHWGRQAISE